MKKTLETIGTNPIKSSKYATKTSSKHGNYGSDNFKKVKRTDRRTNKQALKATY